MNSPWKAVKNGVRTVDFGGELWHFGRGFWRILEDFEPKSVVFATKILVQSRNYGESGERYS